MTDQEKYRQWTFFVDKAKNLIANKEYGKRLKEPVILELLNEASDYFQIRYLNKAEFGSKHTNYPEGCDLTVAEAYHLFNQSGIVDGGVSISTWYRYAKEDKYKLPHIATFDGKIFFNRKDLLAALEAKKPVKKNYEAH